MFKNSQLFISFSVFFLTFVLFSRRGPEGVEAWEYIYWKGVYLTLCSLAAKSLANFNIVKKQSNSRCPLENMYSYSPCCAYIYRCILGFIHIQRGLLRCSFLTMWAMRDAFSSRTGNRYRHPRFFVCTITET